jgi:hypothetical protein
MIIAQEKEKTNVAEYVLYMWQIEDVIRSHRFDINAIEEVVIGQFDVTVQVKLEMKKWYLDLISSMKEEGIEKTGHLKRVTHYVHELSTLHQKLLMVIQDPEYQDLHLHTKGNIDALIKKSKGSVTGDVEACLTGLYGLLVLKLKKSTIHEDTQQAMKTFINLLAYLSRKYQLEREGKLHLSNERNN